ncbi:hypothetical protein FRC0129_00786 [Corynebacterium diphtheriae]|nr:hypothetical protein FRC0129_00786 [Corynebacterium diphtheriae]
MGLGVRILGSFKRNCQQRNGAGGAGVGVCGSRIRDYVNPWSGLRYGHGDAGVFVVTVSWSWFRAGGRENTREHTGERINKLHRSTTQVQFLASIGVIGSRIAS